MLTVDELQENVLGELVQALDGASWKRHREEERIEQSQYIQMCVYAIGGGGEGGESRVELSWW